MQLFQQNQLISLCFPHASDQVVVAAVEEDLVCILYFHMNSLTDLMSGRFVESFLHMIIAFYDNRYVHDCTARTLIDALAIMCGF